MNPDGGGWIYGIYGAGDDGAGDITYTTYNYVDPSGTDHVATSTTVTMENLGDAGYDSDCPASTSTGFDDASGLTMDEGTVYFANGTSTDGATYVKDRAGNEITMAADGDTLSWYDTLSGSAAALTITGSGTPASPLEYKYTGPSGAATEVTVNYTAYTGLTGTCAPETGTVDFPTTVDLPDGSSYTFTYDTGTGLMTKATLPAGGAISYDQTGCGSTAELSRSESLDTGVSWSWSLGSSATTEYDPVGNKTVVWYSGGYPVETDQYTGSSTEVETTTESYTGNASGVGSVTETRKYPGTTELTAAVVTSYNTNEQTTEVDEYDWDETPGTDGAARSTITTYADLGYTGVEVPVSVEVEAGGVQQSKTTYAYDQTAPVSSGAAQNVGGGATCATGVICHGDVTTITYSSSGSGTLSKTFTYYDTGQVEVATDVNGATTTYTYGGCGDSFPTQVVRQVGSSATLTGTMTWNCTGAVMASATDPNGATTSYSYADSANTWRMTGITDAADNATTIAYTPTTVEEATSLGSAAARDVLATVDGLGRPWLRQVRQAPGSSSFDTVATVYDADGRVAEVTAPYTASASASTIPSGTAGTTTTYDGLNRPLVVTNGDGGTVTATYTQNDVLREVSAPSGESAKKRELEYDAFGRLASVCEILAGGEGDSGLCEQNAEPNGLYTLYTYSALNQLTEVVEDDQSAATTWQVRQYGYDQLGRLTSEKNPESGTTDYTYDSDTTCGSSAGDLVKRVDAGGNTSCYSYDLGHRLTQIGYTVASGGTAQATPTKTFVYDAATVNGAAMANAGGRLAEAYTGASGSKATDVGFSYTALGQVGRELEATPESGGYYQVGETYWANGAAAGLTGLGFPTISYGVDGEGRPTTVGDGSGAGAVSAASYNGYGEVTGLTLGSGDSDAFGYDAATGRMTEYQYTVDGTTDTGLLGWNANGSLATLAIADNLSGSGDTQSCSYGYDELERLGSEDCGSGWERSFSYDDFGNAAASGTQSFAADFGSNQIGEVGSYTAGYDKDGDLVNDPVTGTTGEYGWDVEGKLVKAGSVTITRDALGRAAETYDGTTYREVAYAPGGGPVGRLSGGSMVEADVPLPGGGAAVYTGTSGPPARYEHADWEGSVRLTTTAAQGVYGTEAYGAFGAEYDGSGTSPVNYTGERQDTVTGTAGLYDFLMREESPTQGRWLNPDPAGMAAVDPGNPQTWNRYAYVTNQPTFLTDPLGLLEATQPPPPFGCVYGPDGDLECLPPVPDPPAPGPPGTGGGPPGKTPAPPPPPKLVGPANPNDKPDVPPQQEFCSAYRDGTGAGDILYGLCMGFPNGPKSNCMRGKLLPQFVPNDNPLDLIFRYGFYDHGSDLLSCTF